MMVNMLNFMNLVTFSSSLDAKKLEFWAIFSIKSKMAAKKRDLEFFLYFFLYFHINDSQHVMFHDSSLIPSINETFLCILSHCAF